MKVSKMNNPEKKNRPEFIRLNKYLAMAGIGSRRACDQFISEGRIKVNDEVVTTLGVRIDPDKDRVLFDGKKVKPVENLIYILLNKPLKTVTTVDDEKKRRTVIDILGEPGRYNRLFPVGRLDFFTSGALLITNDGELTYYLTHPRFEVKKIYRVLIDKIIRPIDLHRFRTGIDLDGYVTAHCRTDELRIMDNRSFLEVELHEGRNRQIRRMFEKLGYRVEELHRVEFAGLKVTDLNFGEWRYLTVRELERLRRIVDDQKEKINITKDEQSH